MLYLDQLGFGLSLPISYGWFPQGQANQREVPKHFGAAGRLNMMGSLEFGKKLSHRLLEASCTKEVVIAYLHTLAKEAKQANILTVVILDNANFHRAKAVKQHIPEWVLSNLFLRFLPPYSPQLNLIESVWRNLKRFLSPRRAYPSTADLRIAILEALSVLDAC